MKGNSSHKHTEKTSFFHHTDMRQHMTHSLTGSEPIYSKNKNQRNFRNTEGGTHRDGRERLPIK